MDVALDGALLASVLADDRGSYVLDVRISRAQLAGGWHDVYLVFNSISEPEGDGRELRVAALESLEWVRAP
jgi:hypothetical protein